MTWTNPPEAESKLGESKSPSGQQGHSPVTPPFQEPAGQTSLAAGTNIKVGKIPLVAEDGKQMEIFTMTLGNETIDLLPFRHWSQLDTYKWGMKGKLPGVPAGLDITYDHV